MSRTDDVLLHVDRLTLTLPSDSGPIEALSGVDFTVRRGEVFALVPEFPTDFYSHLGSRL